MNFLSCNNDINVETCLYPKWLLCVSVSDDLKYRAAVAVKKYIFFSIFFYYFSKKIKKNKIVFWNKMIFGWFFWVIFRVRQPMEDDLKKNIFQKNKKKYFFLFFGKIEKNWFLVENFFLVIFRRRRPMEDNLTNNLTSLHFPDACVSSI